MFYLPAAQVSTTRIPGFTSRKQQQVVNWHLVLRKSLFESICHKTFALSFSTKASG
jgi:hypothetical protein